MSPGLDARWPEVEVWLDRVLDQPETSREGWLDAQCADAELRALVRALLEADSQHGARLEEHAAAAHAWLAGRATDLPQVPGYRVLRLSGEGGMASVFLAERVLGETVQRVALKRLRLSVYDRDERRRFEHEHRILARLEHPNIARLVDAGIAPDGVPWFAMEHIEGEPLLAWCDARRLPVDGRLALLADTSAAIHHAHQHLVVHRDLKPSNLLVTNEGRGMVLDFGIARLLDPDTGNGDGTRTGQRRLTPGYAAPEQYAGQASTATDVYALGVILVELLSGQRPQPGREPESDPLRGLSVTADVAGARASTTRTLARLLSGDAGAIARKALRSDPALRYGSAQAFGEDLAALRAGRPVAARRGDWRYRAACFVRRNKVAVGATALVAATLVAATGISLIQAHRARQQAERAQAVQGFVENMLAPLREGVPRARMPPLDELLAKGIADLDRSGGRDPAVYSDLLLMFARTYERMGELKVARQLAGRAYAQGSQAFGANDPRTLQALALRGRILHSVGEREQAQADLNTAYRQMRRLGINGVTLAMVLDELGHLHLSQGRSQQAMALYGEAHRQRLQQLGPDHPDIAAGYANQAFAERERGENEAALGLLDQAYRHSVAHQGENSWDGASYLGEAASLKTHLGDWRGGARDFATALAIYGRLEPQDRHDHVEVLRGACQNWAHLDELEPAQRSCDAAVAMAERLQGADRWLHTVARRDRIPLLIAQGQLREARAEGEDIRARLRALPGDQSRSQRVLALVLGDLLWIENDPAPMCDALLEQLRAETFKGWLSEPIHLGRLAVACARAPDPDCPLDLAARADARLAEPLLRDHPLRIPAQLALARLALHRGDAVLALARLDDLGRVARLPGVALRPDHRWLTEARMLRGEALAAQGDAAGARREWLAAEAAFAPRYAADHPFRRKLAGHLGMTALARR